MAHDEWWTKDDDFKKLCDWSGVIPDIDVSADAENTKVKDNYITKEEDATITKWNKNGAKVAFMNPQNSELKLMLRMAMKMWKDENMTILMFVPINIIGRLHFQPYWKLMVKGIIKINEDWKPWLPRPQFLDHGKKNDVGNRNDYMALVLRKREWEQLD